MSVNFFNVIFSCSKIFYKSIKKSGSMRIPVKLFMRREIINDICDTCEMNLTDVFKLQIVC